MSAAVLARRREPSKVDLRMPGYNLAYCVLLIAMAFPFLLIDHHIPITDDTYFVLSMFMLTGVASLVGLYFSARERPFTLNSAHWVFVVFFLWYAPLMQYYTNRLPDQT
ncbi:MAG TPA: hypothetical protein VGS41_04795, partial [Chthonomonadales bacterium]|nr:hypothetical protein [Chthonomonadales bacterium]